MIWRDQLYRTVADIIQVDSTKNCTNVGRVKFLRVSSVSFSLSRSWWQLRIGGGGGDGTETGYYYVFILSSAHQRNGDMQRSDAVTFSKETKQLLSNEDDDNDGRSILKSYTEP